MAKTYRLTPLRRFANVLMRLLLRFGLAPRTTMLLTVLLFPVFYALHQYLEQEKQLTDLDALAMTGIYLLLTLAFSFLFRLIFQWGLNYPDRR